MKPESSPGPTVLEEMAAAAEGALKVVAMGAGVLAGLGIILVATTPTLGGTRSLRIEREARKKQIEQVVSAAADPELP
jgi:hypothetical protein